MKNWILVSLIIFSNNLCQVKAQCSKKLAGAYRMFACNGNVDLRDTATVKILSGNKILISHFSGLPEYIFRTKDTIVANLNCQNDSLYLEPVSYYTYTGTGTTLTYSGRGIIVDTVLLINFVQYVQPPYSYDEPYHPYYQYFCQSYSLIPVRPLFIKPDLKEYFYPNPAFSEIQFDKNQLISSIDIIDEIGKTQNYLLNKNNNLDISKLKQGLYLVKINSTNGTTILKKLIKK